MAISGRIILTIALIVLMVLNSIVWYYDEKCGKLPLISYVLNIIMTALGFGIIAIIWII